MSRFNVKNNNNRNVVKRQFNNLMCLCEFAI